MLSAKEIAQKYAGRTLKCRVTKSSPVLDANGKALDYFDAKILGWKEPQSPLGQAFVCVEILPPGTTEHLLSKFNLGYHYTANRDDKGFGKKLLPEEIISPVDTGTVSAPRKAKVIPEWPHKCTACGSPAQIFGMNIDCSNATCKYKFKTHSGTDLFLPAYMRPPGWDKDPHRKRRAAVDQDDYIVCGICKCRANSGSLLKDKIGVLKAGCPKLHTWSVDLHIGDKIVGKDNVLIYKGKNVFIPYKV